MLANIYGGGGKYFSYFLLWVGQSHHLAMPFGNNYC